jgi:hypothetical protein
MVNKETIHRVEFVDELYNLKSKTNKSIDDILYSIHEKFPKNVEIKLNFEITNSLPFGKLLNESSFDAKILIEMKKSRSFIKVSIYLDFSTITVYYCSVRAIRTSCLQRISKRIGVLYIFLKQFMRFDFPEELFIYFYFTDLQKLVPQEKGKTLGYYEINTGVTIARGNEIAVYREEEYFKVLIHESFHTLGLDFADVDIKFQNKMLKEIFSLNKDVLLSESYAEFYATILNIVFITYEKSFRRFKKKFLYLLEKEKRFKVFQMVKMLDHMTMRYTDFFRPNQFKENTNVFAYYVLCGILLFFAEEFLNRQRLVLQAEQTDDYIGKIVLFIKQYCRDERFLQVIQMTEHSFQNMKVKTKKRKKYHKTISTLRMTLSE